MQLHSRLSALLVLVLSSLPIAIAGPLYRQQQQQQILQPPVQLLPDTAALQTLATTSLPSFGVQENSVGVLFTTDDGFSVEHIWIPLGRKLYTADSPRLPLRPYAARITTMIRSTVDRAAPEVLDHVVCEIWPRWNETDIHEEGKVDGGSVRFSREDDLVRFAEVVGDKTWSPFQEMDAYECAIVDENGPP